MGLPKSVVVGLGRCVKGNAHLYFLYLRWGGGSTELEGESCPAVLPFQPARLWMSNVNVCKPMRSKSMYP